jgi:ABC-type antimicrobial peptide transport system permease subunit
MKIFDILQMGLSNLLRRKTRTFLTVLGVVIGAASIVTMLSLGFGMQAALREQMGGTNSLTLINVNESYSYGDMGGSVSISSSSSSSSSSSGSGSSKRAALNDEYVGKMKQLEHVVGVSPELNAYLRVVCGRYVGDMSVIGVDPEIMQVFTFDLADGRYPTAGENAIVFGFEAAKQFYDPKRYNWADPNNPATVDLLKDKLQLTFDWSYGTRNANQQTRPTLYKTQGVGLLSEKAFDYYWNAYMDINALRKILKENDRVTNAASTGSGQTQRNDYKKYNNVRVKVDDMKNVLAVQEQIKAMGFQTYSSQEYLASAEKQLRVIQLVLGGIGAISLFVAAIGITNTMIMAIHERTREIGVMKVIGATLSDIGRLFLLEAAVIGLSGGLLGALLSFLLSYLLNSLGGGSMLGMPGMKISIIPLWLVGAAMGVSMVVGLLSGYLPARRAMHLSALEAIRNE